MEEIRYFKQLNVYKNIVLQQHIISENQLEGSDIKVCLNKVKVIETMEGQSLEGQILTGKKLVIVGMIRAKIFISLCKGAKKAYWIESYIPFSTFIIVPKETCVEEKMPTKLTQVTYTIEDVTLCLITEHKILLSITLLFEYQDEY